MIGRTKVRPSTPEGFRAIDGRFSFADRPQHPEPPLFAAVYEDAQLFFRQGCENCHSTARQGRHLLDLTTTADRLMSEQITVQILNGGTNMPAFVAILTSREVDLLLESLESRNSSKIILEARETVRK